MEAQEPAAARPRQRAPRINAQTWEQHKPLICSLYVQPKTSVKQIRDILEKDHGFIVTHKQLERQINKTWELRKSLSQEDHKYIEHIQRKRQLDDPTKETRFKLWGVRIDENERDRKRARICLPTYTRLEQLLQPANSPAAPPGLAFSTPSSLATPASQGHDSIAALSPLVFHTPVQRHILTPHAGISSPMAPPVVLVTHILPSFSLETAFARFKAKVHELPSPSPRTPTGTGASPSNLLSFLETDPIAHTQLMKQKYSDLNQFFSFDGLLEILRALVTRIANNIDEEYIKYDDIDAFVTSGLLKKNLRLLRLFLENDSIIVNEFAVQLLYSASRLGEVEIITLLLDLGILQDTLNSRWRNYSNRIGVTALEFAIAFTQGQAFNTLLKKCKNVNIMPISPLEQSLLKTAVEVQDEIFVRELLAKGAHDIVFKERYQSTIHYEDYIDYLESHECSWVRRLENGCYHAPQNALHSAAFLGNMTILEALLIIRSRMAKESFPTDRYDSVAHLFALYSQDAAVLDMVLECEALNLELGAISSSGRSSFAVAINSRNASMIDTFLKKGFTISEDDRSSVALRDRIFKSSLEIKRVLYKHEIILVHDGQEELNHRFFDVAKDPNTIIDCQNGHNDRRRGSFCFNTSPENMEAAISLLQEIYQQSQCSESFLCLNALRLCHYLLSGLRVSIEDVGRNRLASCIVDIDLVFLDKHKMEWFLLFNAANRQFWDSSAGETEDGALHTCFWLKSSLGEDIFDTIAGPAGAIKPWSRYQGHGLEGLHRAMQSEDIDDDDFPELCGLEEGYVPEESEMELIDEIVDFISTFGFRPVGYWADLLQLHRDYLSIHQVFHRLEKICDKTAILRFFAHFNMLDSLQKIQEESPSFNPIVLTEAAWYSNKETFNMVFQRSAEVGIVEEDLAVVLRVAIVKGDLYKAMKVLGYRQLDLNAQITSATHIEIAAAKGCMDITALLLENGATKNLENAQENATKNGHFGVADMINRTITKLASEQNEEILQSVVIEDTIPSTSAIEAASPMEITQGVPPSPREPYVHDLELYVPSQVYDEMFHSQSPFPPILDPYPIEHGQTDDMEF